MFTPQRKGWSVIPREAEKSGALSWKGKGVVEGECHTFTTAPPRNMLGENGGGDGGRAREEEVWKSFREAGLLDSANFERKDREALLQRVAKLEGELYDYQYNMGLLLIEKKQWTSKYDEFQQVLIDAEEILKREQAAHLAAISEIEKRDEDLKKALGVERQCVADLEKALRELHAENAKLKFTSEQKSADASALLANIEDKSLEAEAKQHAADARLSELSRKSSEIERKSQDLVSRESMLQRERASLNIDKELHAKELSRQRNELLIWEKSLQEGQERLVESQNLLNQREMRSNESDLILVKKEKELDAMRERIDMTVASLKEKEDYINLRLSMFADKEKEADMMKECLERKEKELFALEEKLLAREQLEIQKVVEEHKLVLDTKRHDFEMEMEAKRNAANEEFQLKLISMEKRERELSQMQEKLTKQECTLERKITKLNVDIKDLDAQSKLLKTREVNLSRKEFELEKKSKQLIDDEEEFSISKAKLEVEWKSIKAEKAHIIEQIEYLKITEEERLQHNEMQSKLKEEIEEYRILKDLIMKEREDLRHDRENFEREWEVLDEKRVSLSSEARRINEEKEMLEKWKSTEEAKLENELLVTRNNISSEFADLKLRKEAFEGKMELERAEIRERLQQDRENMDREYENKKHELQMEMQKKQEELEQRFKSEVVEFHKTREAELSRLNSLRDAASLDMQKMKSERDMFEREKQEYIIQRKKIEEAQIEIRNDIDSLHSLSKNLKKQREEFMRERDNFLTVVDNCKICQNCGVTIPELAITSFMSRNEIEDPEKALLPSLGGGFLEDGFNSGMPKASPEGKACHSGSSSGRLSWLQSCTKKIFSFSPGRRNDESPVRKSDEPTVLDGQLNRKESVDDYQDSYYNQRVQFDDQMEVAEASDKHDELPYSSVREDNNILHIPGSVSNGITGCTESVTITPSVSLQNEPVTLPTLPKGTSEPAPTKGISGPEPKKGKGRYKGKYLKRTRSVQAVVEESKSILSDDANEEETRNTILQINQPLSALGGHKRRVAQPSDTAASLDADSDTQSESISFGGRKKRRQITAPSTLAAGDNRYNLRRSTIAGGRFKVLKNSAPSQSLARESAQVAAGEVKDAPQSVEVKDTTESEQQTSRRGEEGDEGTEIQMAQRVVSESILEVDEFTFEKVDKIADEEVNCAEASNVSVSEDGYLNEDAECVDTEDDSDDGRINASIGKKIWKFFTS